MVLEQFLDRKTVTRHFCFIFVISAVYVFVAYLAQTFFFPDQNLAIVLLATILLLPSLHHLIVVEERIESLGYAHFWKRHHVIIRCYLGAFCGILAGFLLLGFLNPATLGYQMTHLEAEHLRPELIAQFASYSPSPSIAFALFTHNLMFLLIGFFLSVFYGAGAIFIIAYNVSFFAAFIMELFSRYSSAVELSLVSLGHLLPESLGFLLTAIAGATLSRALIHEKISALAFKNVVRNCILLLLTGIFFVLLAAFIETYGTAVFFHSVLT